MRIKRFEAKDARTALAMVKKEMGEDAVILATRTIPAKNNGGKKQGPSIEVVAAMDYDIDNLTFESANHGPTENQTAQLYDYKTVRRKPEQPRADYMAPSEPAAPPQKKPINHLHTEAHDLRLRFANLMKQTPQAPAIRKPAVPPPQSPPGGRLRQPDPTQVRMWRDKLIDKIQLSQAAVQRPNNAPRIIALVGATGVGKTTTAAKLAAWYSLRQGKNVALLSMDCYRVGATDQLRTYAKIMRLPCEVVLRQQDMQSAIARHTGADIIIIDTAGKSPYDATHITELQEWFSPCGDMEPHLVLSATTKKEDLHTAIKAYADLSVSGLILTKLDETRAYAALCQQVVASSLPVSYLCTGQRVPEDFLVASKDFLDTLFKKGWTAAVPHDAVQAH